MRHQDPKSVLNFIKLKNMWGLKLKAILITNLNKKCLGLGIVFRFGNFRTFETPRLRKGTKIMKRIHKFTQSIKVKRNATIM